MPVIHLYSVHRQKNEYKVQLTAFWKINLLLSTFLNLVCYQLTILVTF